MKLPGLVAAVTKVDGRPEATINHIARQVREAGFIPGGKRGHGGPDMGYMEAAHLLVALHSCAVSSGPVESIPFYGRSKFNPHTSWSEMARLPFFTRVENAANGIEAVAAFLEGAPELATHYIEDLSRTWDQPDVEELDYRWLRYHVTFSQEAICLGVFDGKDRRGWRAKFVVQHDAAVPRPKLPPKIDRYTESTFGLQTAVVIWKALTGESFDGEGLMRKLVAQRKKAEA